jgi:hypothetical protein
VGEYGLASVGSGFVEEELAQKRGDGLSRRLFRYGVRDKQLQKKTQIPFGNDKQTL